VLLLLLLVVVVVLLLLLLLLLLMVVVVLLLLLLLLLFLLLLFLLLLFLLLLFLLLLLLGRKVCATQRSSTSSSSSSSVELICRVPVLWKKPRSLLSLNGVFGRERGFKRQPLRQGILRKNVMTGRCETINHSLSIYSETQSPIHMLVSLLMI
jgi:hypothetical protein